MPCSPCGLLGDAGSVRICAVLLRLIPETVGHHTGGLVICGPIRLGQARHVGVARVVHLGTSRSGRGCGGLLRCSRRVSLCDRCGLACRDAGLLRPRGHALAGCGIGRCVRYEVGSELANSSTVPAGEARFLDRRLWRAAGAHFLMPPTHAHGAGCGTGRRVDQRHVCQVGGQWPCSRRFGFFP